MAAAVIRAGDHLSRRLPARAPSTYNPETRQFEATIATTAPVRRRFYRDGQIVEADEVLDMAPTSIRMDRLQSGRLALLNAHSQFEIGAQIGVIEQARIEGSELVGIARVSGREELAGLRQDLADGIVGNVSVGYVVHEYRRRDRGKDQVPEMTAVDWEVLEASLVPVPADAAARVRSLSTRGVQMAEDVAGAGSDMARSDDFAAGVAAERARQAGIRLACKAINLDTAIGQRLIEQGASLDAARAALIEEGAARDEARMPALAISGGFDPCEPNGLHEARRDGLVSRLTGQPAQGRAVEYASASIPGLARECLKEAGVFGAERLSDAQAVVRSFEAYSARAGGLGAMHTTSDLPSILIDAVHVATGREFQTLRNRVLQTGVRRNFSDFRLQNHVAISEAPGLEPLGEHGEVQQGYFRDSGESWRGRTYARRTSITREALINDNTGVLSAIPRKFARDAASLEGDLVASLLAEGGGLGPILSDGLPVFHADHGNLGTASAISNASLEEAILKLRTQTGPNGRLIEGNPQFLLVPAALEFLARQYLTNISATETSAVNPLSELLTLVVEPRLDAISTTAWYVIAPDHDGLAWGTLEGSDSPQVSSQIGFEVEGVAWKVRHDAGAGFIGHRAWFRNAGQ